MTDERVKRAIEDRRDIINGAIDELLPIKDPERLYRASRHLLTAGGKRLRPAMLLLVGESLSSIDPETVDYRSFPDLHGETVDLLAAGMAIEVIQTFTLIHDDIMDDDDLRRGVPAVHKAFDQETAILAGDTLYSQAFEMMLDAAEPPERVLGALDVLAETCTQICEGQSMDVEFENRAGVTAEEYLSMVEHKTAVLYGASACIPAYLLGAEQATIDSLYRYGIDVGKAFQIQDDVLDLTVPSDVLGKQRGSDLVENKQTLITVHARDHGVDVDGLVTADSVEAVEEADIEAAVEELEAAGSIEFAKETARSLIDSGKSELEVLPENNSRALLEELADYLIERGY